jgi:hypothetical protein
MVWILLGPAFLLAGSPLTSADVEYVQGLRKQGLAALAVDYLGQRRSDPPPDPAVRADVDFEWGAALLASSELAVDLTERERALDQARLAFGAFGRAYPNHPKSVDATVQEAGIELGRGRIRVLQAQLPGNEAKSLDLARSARESFGRAEKAYRLADGLITKELEKLTGFLDPQKERGAYRRRERLFEEQVEARFQSGLTLFLMADSYATIDDRAGDPRKRKEFTAALRQAMVFFDQLAEEHRREVAGLYGSLWSARCLTALGEHTKANAILDSLLAHENRELETFQREVFHFRLLSLAAEGKDEQVVQLATPWLKENSNRRKESSYQGVQWALAKSLVRLGEKQADEKERERFYREGDDLLGLIARSRGSFSASASREQLMLSRRRSRAMKGNSFVSLSAEGMARLDEIPSDASDEEKSRLRGEAISKLEESLSKVNERDRADDISEVKCRLARAYFDAGAFDKSISLTDAMVRAEPEVPRSAEAALLAVSAYARRIEEVRSLKESTSTAESPVSRLETLAAVITKRWPRSTPSDQVRLLLAKLAYLDGDWEKAVRMADGIDSDPLLQALGGSLAASATWRQAIALDESAPARGTGMTDALARMKRVSSQWPADPSGSLSADRFRHEVARGEAELFAGHSDQAKEAADLLAKALLAKDGPTLEPGTRTSGVATVMRTWLALGEVDRSRKFFEEVAPSLRGKEEQGMTAALLTLVRSIRSGQASGGSSGQGRPSKNKGLQSLLDQVSEQGEKLPTRDRLYLADAYLSAGDGAKGLALIEAALASATGAEMVTARLLRARAQSLLGKHGEAVTGITELLKENVGSKEVIVARGEILEAASDSLAAIKHWQWYLDRLKRVQPRPVELYEVADRICRLALAARGEPQEVKKQLSAALRLPAFLLETDATMPAAWRTTFGKRMDEIKRRLAGP